MRERGDSSPCSLNLHLFSVLNPHFLIPILGSLLCEGPNSGHVGFYAQSRGRKKRGILFRSGLGGVEALVRAVFGDGPGGGGRLSRKGRGCSGPEVPRPLSRLSDAGSRRNVFGKSVAFMSTLI